MVLFYQPRLAEGATVLEEDESRHCVKVLRKNVGDSIRITDGQGRFYNATITKADARACTFQVDESWEEPPRGFNVHIAISPTKNADRIEWMVEKCVEIGVDEITLLDCEHTERTFQKTDRLVKVAVSAMKQSLKATLPRINPLTSFQTLVNNCKATSRFIAFVDTSNPVTLMTAAKGFQDALILIGPEGDFTGEELAAAVNNGFQKVSLGPSRLRTETAGLAACVMLNAVKMLS